MESADRGAAWLETGDGQFWDLKGNCRLGRDPKSDVVVDSEKSSRNHAAIHVQEGPEFWLVDLRSLNGTFRNDEQVFFPVKLKHQDKITIGGIDLRFCQPAAAGGSTVRESGGHATVLEMRERKVWLMIADIVDYTNLLRTLSPKELSDKVGGWFQDSSSILQNRGSRISKYLGDGFLAYWSGKPSAAAVMADTLRDFHALRAGTSLKFRIAVHYGSVTFGGQSTFGEESMFGEDQNFTFRLEKLARKLGLAYCVSEPAKLLLEPHLPLQAVPGEFELDGFDGQHRCYQVVFLD